MPHTVESAYVTRIGFHGQYEVVATTWQSAVAVMMGVILTNGGCMMAVGPHLLPSRTRVVQKTEKVEVTSEPTGADVTRDGLVIGQTPTEVELQYDRTLRLRDCRFTVPLALLDLALAGAAFWGSYSLYMANRNAEPETPQALYNVTGLLGMLLAGTYALGTPGTLRKSECDEDARDVGHTSRTHDVRLSVAGAEERLSIVAPTETKKLNIVFRKLEDSRWRAALDRDNEDLYRRYLDEYPSGQRRAQAKARIEELTWRRASAAGTAAAFWGYLLEYPSGHRQAEAERALKAAVEAAPEAVDKKTLRAMLLGENSAARALGVGELLRQGADAEVNAILSDRSIDRGKRRGLVKSLGVVTQSGQAAAARDVLCRFADSRKKLAAILHKCDVEFASPECDFWEAMGYQARRTDMALCRSDESGTTCVYRSTPDCASRAGRRRCKGDTQQEAEVVEAAAEVGRCQEN